MLSECLIHNCQSAYSVASCQVVVTHSSHGGQLLHYTDVLKRNLKTCDSVLQHLRHHVPTIYARLETTVKPELPSSMSTVYSAKLVVQELGCLPTRGVTGRRTDTNDICQSTGHSIIWEIQFNPINARKLRWLNQKVWDMQLFKEIKKTKCKFKSGPKYVFFL